MAIVDLISDDRVGRLEARAARERRARLEAERLLEAKSRELYEANERLMALAASLEQRVNQRTDELTVAHRRAIELAELDTLTGLANRGRFVRLANDAIHACRAQGTRAAFLVIDVDRFKETNDTFGHETGDALLQHVARQFRTVTRSTDIVARVGGDEFCVIFPLVDDDISVPFLVERLRRTLQTPLQHAGRSFFAKASMGFAIFPDHGASLNEVLRHADLALYSSKAAGRGVCTAFDCQMREDLEHRQALEISLRRAVEGETLEAWFQPIVDGATGLTCGVETLVRWRRDDGSILSPADFLEVAEDRGLMPALFRNVLRKSLLVAREQVARQGVQFVTVNLSPSQFKFDNLTRDVDAILAETGFPADCLFLEITEEVLLTEFDRAREQLHQLTERGIRIALDDFGNGYANISYLKRLPIQKLKLDRSMTADVVHDRKAQAIVTGVAQLASALDMSIVAEGVESAEQARTLLELGCKHQQGYHFARPMPPADLGPYLRERLLRILYA